MDTKLYKFSDCPGVVWEQRELRYLQFEKIKNDFVEFIQSLSPESDLIVPLNKFFDQNIKQAVMELIRPHAHANLWKRFVQWYHIRTKKIDVAQPIRYMSLSEVAVTVNDFFFLNRQWMDRLNDSAASVGGILQTTLATIATMTNRPDQARSSGSSPVEETKTTND